MVDHDKGFILIIQDRLPTVEAFAVLPFPDRLVFSGYLLDPVELPLFRVVIPFDIRVYVVAGAFDRSQEGIRKVDNLYGRIFGISIPCNAAFIGYPIFLYELLKRLFRMF